MTTVQPHETTGVAFTLNGEAFSADVEPRRTLSDVIREDAELTGTHLGCEHGVCGACTVLVDGQPARSCLMLAVQADGAEITTIEGLAEPDGTLHLVQQAMHEVHGGRRRSRAPQEAPSACARRGAVQCSSRATPNLLGAPSARPPASECCWPPRRASPP